MKAAVAYMRGGVVYFSPSSRTSAGAWIETAPVLKVEVQSPHSAKGEAVAAVLNASRDPVPHPTDFAGLVAPLLELSGAKSYAAFAKNARCVRVEVREGRMRLIPYRNLGSKEGFEEAFGEDVEIPFPSSPDRVGLALEEAMARCR
jgi:hypothetical protein